VLVAAAVLAVPVSASAGDLTLRVGAFIPSVNSNLFSDDSDLYSRVGSGDATPAGLKKSDWIGVSGGLAYFSKIAPNVQLGVSVDGYGRQFDTSYRNYTRPDGSEVQQTLRVRMIPLGLSIRIAPTSRRARLAPYIEFGGDAISYKYEEFGDFIDFQDDSLPVKSDAFVSEGFGFGYHVAAGLKIPISPDFSIVGEGRYQHAKDRMGDDFRNNEIDLSGWTATVGFNVRF
jgi:opacity protein-like surface antigen